MTTPTGIPITRCPECEREHPVGRRHCEQCGTASAFIQLDGRCVAWMAADHG